MFAFLLYTYPVYKVWAFIISVTKSFTSFPIFHFVYFSAPRFLYFLLFALDRFCSTCDQLLINILLPSDTKSNDMYKCYRRPKRYPYLCNISFEKPSYPSSAAHIMFSHLCIENDRSHYSLDIFSDTQPCSFKCQDKMPGHHESRKSLKQILGFEFYKIGIFYQGFPNCLCTWIINVLKFHLTWFTI